MSENFNNQDSEKEKRNNFKNSITFKMFIIGFLILILLIPLFFVRNLINERAQTKGKAVAEINNAWGENIKLFGPILKIPYKTYEESTETDVKTGKTIKIQNSKIDYAYFFPKELNVEGTLTAKPKKRGIYETAVYIVETNIGGSFEKPNFTALEISNQNILWDKAQLVFETSNVKGIKSQLEISLGDTTLVFKADYDANFTTNDSYNPKNKQKILISTSNFDTKDFFERTNQGFDMHFAANGSSSFEIIPIGKETNMHLQSKWKDSNFFGTYLPYNENKVTKNGFDALWKVLDMNRPFPQEFNHFPSLDGYAFGVEFMIPVDDYQQNERSAKYGYLVISLTFLLFFLIQTLSKINIHPFQYLMIGLALIIFYTLLLSITEHSSFQLGYLIATIATIVLIGLFSKSIMKHWKFPIFIILSLAMLYGFIFVIIQLENYALLVGSIGLFTILASVMYTSRKIDWGS